MRLPFLQMESDLLAHGLDGMAALLGCSAAAALGHVGLLRAWAVSRAGDAAAPDGWVPGPNAARLIAAGARWEGDASAFVAALSDPGVTQLAIEEGGIRILHLEPYVQAWERNASAKERMRNARERSANVQRTSAHVSGQTQTQTQKEADLPPPSSAGRDELRLEPQVAAKRTRAKEKPPAAVPDPRHAPLVKALEAAGWAHHGGRTAGAVKELLALADRTGAPGEAAHEEVLRRAAIARAHEGFPRVREVHELPKHWGHFERAPAPVHRGGPSPPSDFSRIAPPPPRSLFAAEVSDEPF